MSRRTLLQAAAFAALALPIGFGFLAEAAENRAVAFLEAIRAAEEGMSFSGRRVVTLGRGAEATTLRADILVSRPHVYRVEPVGGPEAAPRGFLRGAVERTRGAIRRGRLGPPDLIARNYRVVPGPDEEIAGHPAQWIGLEPRHEGRSRYRLAVDAATRFPLAYQAWGPDGTLTYESRFETVRLNIPSLPREEAAAPRRPRGTFERVVTTPEKIAGLVGFPVWKPTWIPDGYRLQSWQAFQISNLGESVLARYSDGMSSIFLAQVDGANPQWQIFRTYLGLEPPEDGTSGDLVVHRISHPGGSLILDLSMDGTEVLLGGQLPSEELERMAAGLVRID